MKITAPISTAAMMDSGVESPPGEKSMSSSPKNSPITAPCEAPCMATRGYESLLRTRSTSFRSLPMMDTCATGKSLSAR
jgi:hypothetical protein